MAVSSIGASWGQQVTLKDNFQPVQTSVISYPALPSTPTWSSIARLNIPAGESCRVGSYKEWISAHLCFDYGCGVTSPVGDVTNISATPLQIINSFRSIELRCQEQSLFLLDNNDLGCITQMWMQNILKKSAPDIYTGASLLPHILGLHNYMVDYEFPGIDLLHARVYGTMMIKNCRLDLSDVFNHLFSHVDPRGFGANLEIVIQMQDYPCVFGRGV